MYYPKAYAFKKWCEQEMDKVQAAHKAGKPYGVKDPKNMTPDEYATYNAHAAEKIQSLNKAIELGYDYE